jgi:cell division protein FtsL
VSARVSKKERLLWISVLSATIVIFVLVISKYQTTLTSVNQRVTGLESAKTTWIQR